jgi:hypothetical protein
VNLDDLRRDRPHLVCEPQQARRILRKLQEDETDGAVTEVCRNGVVAMDGVNLAKPPGYSVRRRRQPETAPVTKENRPGTTRPIPHRRCGLQPGDAFVYAPVTRDTGSRTSARNCAAAPGFVASAASWGNCSDVTNRPVAVAVSPTIRIFVVDKGGGTVSADRPGSRRFATMAQIESKHDVRRKVRDAQAQANRERLERESDNREDMVAFLVAEQKLSAVSEWEAERHEQVRLEADQRRAEQRLEGARALARMRDRGETVASIARLGGCTVKLVRRYLKELHIVRPSRAPIPGMVREH